MRVTDERLAELERSFAHVSANVDGTKLPIGDLIADLQDARVEIERLRRERKHRLPLIVVRDKYDGKEHIVGADTHDTLLVDDDGSISYMNLQNGEGTGPESSYEFVTEFDGCWTTILWSEGD